MFVTMKRHDFDSLEQEALGLACIQPTLLRIRAKDLTVKEQAYSELTQGQQMLMMFRVIHGHVGESADQLFAWVNYLLREEPRTWAAFQHAMVLLGDAEMLEWTAEIEQRDETAQERLHARYHELAVQTNQRIAEYIRAHQEQFVVFED